MTAQIMREVFRCGQTLLAMSSNGKSKKHATRFCIRYKGLARESPRNSNSPEWRRPESLEYEKSSAKRRHHVPSRSSSFMPYSIHL
jgi:hypothetical protein